MDNSLTNKKSEKQKSQYYGNVYLPSGEGTKVGEFRFILDDKHGYDVQIGSPVTAETAEGSLIGVVVDMRTHGDDDNVRSTLLAGSDRQGKIGEAMLATVQIFWSESLRPPRPGKVRAATDKEILQATGCDRMDYHIPAGCIRGDGGKYAPVYFDGRALLGPEAAHLMVSGLSGQAAKTSYMGVLLAATLHQDPKETGESVAALIFNVKGEDMLYLDQPPEDGYELDELDRELYKAMKMPAEPFSDVTVYAPPLAGGTLKDTSSARNDGTVLPLSWDLVQVWNYLSYFFREVYEDEKVSSFLAEYYEQYLISRDPSKAIYKTFAGLEKFFDDHTQTDIEDTGYKAGWRSHHVMTLWRLRRMLTALPARCRGLLTKETARPQDDIPTNQWTHGQVVVVDIAGLRPDVQSLVIARTCERMLKEAEDGDLGVDHLVVMTDELNVFAAQGATALSGVRRILQRISTQGRYAGVSLFGAAQKLSKVDELTRDNAATRAMGITPDAELSSGVYGRLPAGLHEQIATLSRGEMALSHYSYRAPLVVKFPRPSWKTGRPKTRGRRPVATDILGLSDKALTRLTEGVNSGTVDDILAQSDNPDEARIKLEQARRPDMRKAALHEPYTTDPQDPFGEEDDPYSV